MESRGQKAENNHKGTSLYKGKSDSLILRWPSLDKHMQSEASTTQRIINRKYGGASRHNYTHPVRSRSTLDGDEFSTQELPEHSMLSRTSSTTSLSLGIAGPLIFPSDHVLASIAAGSKSKEEEGDSDEAEEAAICVKGNTNIVAPTNDSVSISMHHQIDSPNTKALPLPPPIALKFVDVTYQVSKNDGKDDSMLRSCVLRMRAKLGMRRDKVEREESRKKKKKREKRLVKGITGNVKAGEVLALMGPSGSGKTTVLNILSGRSLQTQGQHADKNSQTRTPYCDAVADVRQHAGSVTYNDMPYSKALKRRIGFVTQDDVLYPHLTVKETLVYAALLRLPQEFSKKEKVERAMEVVYELGLERCQHTIVGGAFLRGVSGGERKRVCIGQEVLIDPSVLFLDEPTSGLDSTTALRIVQMLRKISRGGRTVVTTIHQPSSRIFHMFDRLLLLSGGHMLYFGTASAAMDYFSSIGFTPQIAMNPADFLLDLASGNVVDMSLPFKLTDRSEGHKCVPLDTKGNGSSSMSSVPCNRPLPKEVRKYLVAAYELHKQGLQGDVHKTKLQAQEKHVAGKQGWQWNEPQEWSTTWWSQFCVLYMRGLRERRHEYLSSLRIMQVFASAVVIGCLWWHSNIETQRQLTDQVGLLFFIATYWGFFPLFTALFTFPVERAILAKERASNMYRLSAYFMARTLGDVPLDFCLPLLFHVIVYFMTHLRPTTSAFFLTLLIILLSTIASQGMGIAIGAIFMDLKKATTLASVVLLTFMLSGGFFVQATPSFISWIKYISYNYYTFKLLASLQYDSTQKFGCDTLENCQKVENSTVFHNVSLDGGVKEVAILLSMIIGYRFVAYIALRYMQQVS